MEDPASASVQHTFPSLWEKDAEVNFCRACAVEFTLFTRKHHCRGCGRIFCAACTEEKILIKDQPGPQRSCYECYLEVNPLSVEEQEIINSVIRQHGESPQYIERLIVEDAKHIRQKSTLVIGSSIIVVLLVNSSKKILPNCHLIDLKAIRHTGSCSIRLEFGFIGNEFFVVIETSKIGKLIKAIREAYYKLTAGSPCDIIVEAPPELLLDLRCDIEIPQSAHRFEIMYNALCAYYSIIPSSDAVHYFEGLFMEKNIEVNLSDCPGLEIDSPLAFDIRPLIQAIGMNTYFRSVIIDNISDQSCIPEFCSVLQKNKTITRLVLSNLPKKTKLEQLGTTLRLNLCCAITDLCIINVNLNKASASSLTTALGEFCHGLRILKLSNCSLNSKQIVSLIKDGLMKNYPMSLTLKELDLSGNRFDDEGSDMLQKFSSRIGPYSPLQRLILRKCNLSFLFLARVLHLFEKLQEIDISENTISDSSVQLLCMSFERSLSLQSIGFVGCNLKRNALKSFSNSFLKINNSADLKINLSDNPFTVHCVQALFSPLQQSWMIHTLDLSNCKINDSICQALCSALQSLNNCKLRRLVLDEAKLDSILLSQRTGQLVAESMGKMLNTCTSIQSLSLAGGYSVNILLLLFSALEKNSSLVDLNVSNNKLGDSGASSLAELIRKNNSLVSITCDGNNFTLQGFYSLGLSVRQSNLQHFSIPWNDLTQNMASNKGKCKLPGSLLMKIYLRLHENRVNSVYCEYIENADRNPITMNPLQSAIVPQPLVDQLDDTELAELNEISGKIALQTTNWSTVALGNPFYRENPPEADLYEELPPDYPELAEEDEKKEISTISLEKSDENEPKVLLDEEESDEEVKTSSISIETDEEIEKSDE